MMLQTALAYASRGWPVLALRPRAKPPLTHHGVNDATTDEGQIRQWWGATPDANIGIATGGGRFVVDIDDRNDGQESWVNLIGEHGRLLMTVSAATGGGGWHIWFGGLDGYRLPGKLARGVDIKSGGGYVVAPPSIHPSGGTYTWVRGRSPEEIDLAPAPTWLARKLTEHIERSLEAVDALDPAPVPVVERARRYLARCDPGISGQRGHASTFRAAQVLIRGFALNEQQAFDLMREFSSRCSPPWGDHDIQHKLRQAARRGEMTLGALL